MKLDITYLQPGEIMVVKEPQFISTILGSCVSVCLFDSIRKVAGMNHYLFPEFDDSGAERNKYGDIAIRALLDKILKSGSPIDSLVAKIFGGAKINSSNLRIFNAGQQNAQIATLLLKRFKIPIIAEDLGGNQGRRLEFNTGTGKVKLTYLKNLEK